jgi:hypothetical protein
MHTERFNRSRDILEPVIFNWQPMNQLIEIPSVFNYQWLCQEASQPYGKRMAWTICSHSFSHGSMESYYIVMIFFFLNMNREELRHARNYKIISLDWCIMSAREMKCIDQYHAGLYTRKGELKTPEGGGYLLRNSMKLNQTTTAYSIKLCITTAT